MELLIEHLKNLGSEYQITTSTGVVCSSEKYDEVNKSNMVAVNMYSYDGKYYDKKNQMFEINGVTYTISVYVNITRYANEIVKSKIDCLTKLPNRTQMQEFLSHINKKCVIVMCDIDNFKKVNDFYGHQVGDDAIRLVGNLIRHTISENDFAGRYGGEEFLIVFDDIDANQVKAKMDDFNELMSGYTNPLRLSSSIGIHCYDPCLENVHDAIKKADEALYYVKNNGKNASVIYENMKKYDNK